MSMRPRYCDWPSFPQPPLTLFLWLIGHMSEETGAIVVEDSVLAAATGLSPFDLSDALECLIDLGYIETDELGDYLRIQICLWDIYDNDQVRSAHEAEEAYEQGFIEETDEFFAEEPEPIS